MIKDKSAEIIYEAARLTRLWENGHHSIVMTEIGKRDPLEAAAIAIRMQMQVREFTRYGKNARSLLVALTSEVLDAYAEDIKGKVTAQQQRRLELAAFTKDGRKIA